jgi:hypothetical protein
MGLLFDKTKPEDDEALAATLSADASVAIDKAESGETWKKEDLLLNELLEPDFDDDSY